MFEPKQVQFGFENVEFQGLWTCLAYANRL